MTPTRSRIRPRNLTGVTRHGTQAGYKSGCRCDDCRRAATRAMKAARLHRIERGPHEVDATGTRRRILALMVNGWRQWDIAAESGVTVRTVGRVAIGSVVVVNVATADALRVAYDRLSLTIRPADVRTTNAARRLGGHPPLCWDDDEIDDPAATPHVESSRSRRKVHVEDIEWLLEDQPLATAGQLGDRLGVTPDAVAQACRRADRADLVARLARNARLLTDVIPGEVAS